MASKTTQYLTFTSWSEFLIELDKLHDDTAVVSIVIDTSDDDVYTVTVVRISRMP